MRTERRIREERVFGDCNRAHSDNKFQCRKQPQPNEWGQYFLALLTFEARQNAKTKIQNNKNIDGGSQYE
jgi:hypothetical protein